MDGPSSIQNTIHTLLFSILKDSQCSCIEAFKIFLDRHDVRMYQVVG